MCGGDFGGGGGGGMLMGGCGLERAIASAREICFENSADFGGRVLRRVGGMMVEAWWTYVV